MSTYEHQKRRQEVKSLHIHSKDEETQQIGNTIEYESGGVPLKSRSKFDNNLEDERVFNLPSTPTLNAKSINFYHLPVGRYQG